MEMSGPSGMTRSGSSEAGIAATDTVKMGGMLDLSSRRPPIAWARSWARARPMPVDP